MRRNLWITRVSIGLLAFLTAATHAAEPVDHAAEVQQAAAEDAAASTPMFATHTGKLVLFTPAQKEEYAECGAVGTFTTPKTVYLVKVLTEKTLDELKPLDGKECSVTAKIRNASKYIVIQTALTPGAEYIYQKRRGGMGM